MLRILGALACLLALVGCTSAPKQAPSPQAATSLGPPPSGGVYLTSLGLSNAPAGFSLPAEVTVTDRVDQSNQVSLVLSSPDGFVIAGYLREHLPGMGYTITADRDNSLLFDNGTVSGAFYAEGALSALSLRLDQERTD